MFQASIPQTQQDKFARLTHSSRCSDLCFGAYARHSALLSLSGSGPSSVFQMLCSRCGSLRSELSPSGVQRDDEGKVKSQANECVGSCVSDAGNALMCVIEAAVGLVTV